MWIIGNHFVKETINALYGLRNKAAANNNDAPYIFQRFNVKDFFAGTGYSGINRMIHPLVKALNENHHLPQYKIMLPDRDILTALHKSNINAALLMGSTLHYLIKQIDMFLERRKRDLLDKKPGALAKMETKVIWVRTLKRIKSPGFLSVPTSDNPSPLQEANSLRGKFNSILEERLFDGKQDVHRIMSIDARPEEFDIMGNLTSAGKESFWMEVIRGFKKFDKNEISL